MPPPNLPPLPPQSPSQNRPIPDGTAGRHGHAAQKQARHHPMVTPETVSTVDVHPTVFPIQPTPPAAKANWQPSAQQGNPTGIVPFQVTAHGQPAPPGFDPHQYQAQATRQTQALCAIHNSDPRGFSPLLRQAQAQAMQPQPLFGTATNLPPGFNPVEAAAAAHYSQEKPVAVWDPAGYAPLQAAQQIQHGQHDHTLPCQIAFPLGLPAGHVAFQAEGFAQAQATGPWDDVAFYQGIKAANAAIWAQELQAVQETRRRALAAAKEQQGRAVAPAPSRQRSDSNAGNQPTAQQVQQGHHDHTLPGQIAFPPVLPAGHVPFQAAAFAQTQAMGPWDDLAFYQGFNTAIRAQEPQAMQQARLRALAAAEQQGSAVAPASFQKAGFAQIQAMGPWDESHDLAFYQGINTAIWAKELQDLQQIRLCALAAAKEQQGSAVATAPPRRRPDSDAGNRPTLVHSPHGSLPGPDRTRPRQDSLQSSHSLNVDGHAALRFGEGYESPEQQIHPIAPAPLRQRPGSNAGNQPTLVHSPRESLPGPDRARPRQDPS